MEHSFVGDGFSLEPLGYPESGEMVQAPLEMEEKTEFANSYPCFDLDGEASFRTVDILFVVAPILSPAGVRYVVSL